jgi:hypothetical protein
MQYTFVAQKNHNAKVIGKFSTRLLLRTWFLQTFCYINNVTRYIELLIHVTRIGLQLLLTWWLEQNTICVNFLLRGYFSVTTRGLVVLILCLKLNWNLQVHCFPPQFPSSLPFPPASNSKICRIFQRQWSLLTKGQAQSVPNSWCILISVIVSSFRRAF